MNKPEDTKCYITFFPVETVVSGNIISDKDLVLEGVVDGNITSGAKVQIEASACVKGNVSCSQLYCEGVIEGNVNVVNCCELNNKARIIGEVECASLVASFDCIIEKGLRLKK